MTSRFNYQSAVSRNIGWVTEAEQALLATKKIAIAGLGGVGGEHLITLTRLGLTQFHISDFDEFDVHNFNRQIGATMDSIDQPKLDTLEQMTLSINPEAQIKTFPFGVNQDNVDAFLEGVDVYVDSLDFFAMEARELVFRKCADKGIPVITTGPIGFGVAMLCFMPGSMDFDEYFGFSKCHSKQEKLLKFMVGLTPALLQRDYLVDPSRADFAAEKGPSVIMGVKLCAGVNATNVLKILLNRGDIICAPHGLHFDAYKNKLVKTWCPFGNDGLLQRIKYQIAKRVLLSN